MNGILLGLLALLFVALVVLSRPVLARIGAGYALVRPRHSVAIVFGLMVAGMVVVSAGLVGDSAGENYMDTVLSRTAYGDGMISSSNARMFIPLEEAQAVMASRQLEGVVAEASPAIRMTLPMDAQGAIRGRDGAVVWGVDPAMHPPLRNAQTVDGDIPRQISDWKSDEVVLTRRLAADLGAQVGDTVFLYAVEDTEAQRQPPPPLNTHDFPFSGSLSLATQNPLDGSYVHSPFDEWEIPFDLEPGTQRMLLQFQFTSSTPGEVELVLHLLHEGEFHSEHRFTQEGNITLSDPPSGAWTLQVHSELAQDLNYSGSIMYWYRDPSWVPPVTDPKVVPLSVRALIEDHGSDIHHEDGVAFVPLATIQDAFEVPGQVNAVFVKATEGTDMDLLQARLLDATLDGWSGAQVTVPLAGVEQIIEQIRFETRVFFLSSSMFTFLAGLLLIVVIMALLAEERKTTIATMRALGAGRSAVTRMHITEGAIYSAGAAVVAVVMGSLLVASLQGPLGRMYPEIDAFRLHFQAPTILAAMGVSFALTVATITVAAHRATRLDPVAAMRGEEEVDRGTLLTGTLIAGFMGATGLLLLLIGLMGNPFLLLLGMPLVAFGGVLLLRRAVKGDLLMVGASATVLVWTAWRVQAIDLNDFSISQWLVLPAGAVLIGLSAAGLFVYSGWLHGLLVAATARVRGLGPVVETALSHLRARPGRAFLTIGMLATVLLVITTMGTLAATFGPSGYEETGGFSVFGDTYYDLGDPQRYLDANPPVSGVDPFRMTERWTYTPWVHQDRLVEREGENSYRGISYDGMVDRSSVGVLPGFIEQARFKDATMEPQYGDLSSAMQAVANDPGLAILSDRAFHWRGERDQRVMEPVQVGDRLYVADSEGEYAPVRVVALIHNMDGVSSLLHPQMIETIAARQGIQEPGTRIWAEPAHGVSDGQLKEAFESAFRGAGLYGTIASDPYPEWSGLDRAFMLVFMIFLSLGLVIGIVALGLVTVRNTMVRRREIGVIRAMGGSPGQVLLMFAVEAFYVVLAAIVIGLLGGLWVVGSMIHRDDYLTLHEGVFLVVDPLMLGSIYGVTLLAGITTAMASSWHSSRIPPAEAVRYIE